MALFPAKGARSRSLQKVQEAQRATRDLAAASRAAEPTVTVRILVTLPNGPRDQLGPSGIAQIGQELELAESYANVLIANGEAELT